MAAKTLVLIITTWFYCLSIYSFVSFSVVLQSKNENDLAEKSDMFSHCSLSHLFFTFIDIYGNIIFVCILISQIYLGFDGIVLIRKGINVLYVKMLPS